MWQCQWYYTFILFFRLNLRQNNLIQPLNAIKQGNPNDDFVDRANHEVSLIGNKYTMNFDWGNLWRTFDDSSDADQS